MIDLYIEDLYEAFFSMQVTPLSASLKLLLSFLLGAIIGIERQTRRQSAGMRTISLICIGCTSAMLLSIWIPQSYPHFLNGDPGRIAAQVLAGIGFLGAGAIIQSRGSVKGLTTAATIWVTAIIGLSVGAGFYIPAVVLTFMALFVLVALEKLEKRRFTAGEVKVLIVDFDKDDGKIDDVISIVRANSIYIFDISVKRNYKQSITQLSLKIQIAPQKTLSNVFEEIQKIDNVTSINLITI